MAVPTETAPAELCRSEPGPAQPLLAAGVVHVWRADLRSVDDRMLRSLSPDERERATRILNAGKGALWARSRGTLRELLGRYTETPPERIGFRVDAGGKPRLEAKMSEGELFFSVSHSGWLALFAISREGPVGVDVELRRKRKGRQGAAPADRSGTEFLRGWTRAEAIGKCLGTGISVEVPCAQRSPHTAAVWLGELDLGAHAIGALAASPAPRSVHRFERGS